MKLICTVFLFVVSNSFGQTGMWTWMKGDTIYSAGNYGTIGVPSPSVEPRPRAFSSTWYDASTNRLWVYGGYSNGMPDTVFSDLCRYDVATNNWAWVSGTRDGLDHPRYGTKGVEAPSNHPGSRQSAASWIDLQGNLWVYGGAIFEQIDYTSSTFGQTKWFYASDLWMYNVSTGNWKWMNGSRHDGTMIPGVKGVAAAGNSPGLRTDASTWTDKSGNLWLFGGNVINDLWKYDIATNMWTLMHGDYLTAHSAPVYDTKGVASPANSPGYRRECVSWADTAGNLWLYGGSTIGAPSFGQSDYAEVWKYDIATNMWTWVSGKKGKGIRPVFGSKAAFSSTVTPGSRYGAVGAADKTGNLYLFGGFDSARNNVLWEYSISRNEWRWIMGDTATDSWSWGVKGVPSASNLPHKSYKMSCWREADGAFWLFSGLTYDNALWRYTPGTTVPLHLLTFTGKLHADAINLQWTSENEQGFSHYEVDRSGDARKWSKIGGVKSKGESRRSDYQYSDPIISHLSSVNSFYYRLKMVDNDGSFKYSNVVTITLNSKPEISIYPNPAKDHITIQLPTSNLQHPTVVEISDVTGKVVLRRQWSVVSGPINLSTNKLINGAYTVKVRVGEDVWSEKVIVNK